MSLRPWARKGASLLFMPRRSPWILPVLGILGTRLSPCLHLGWQQLHLLIHPRGGQGTRAGVPPGARAVPCPRACPLCQPCHSICSGSAVGLLAAFPFFLWDAALLLLRDAPSPPQGRGTDPDQEEDACSSMPSICIPSTPRCAAGLSLCPPTEPRVSLRASRDVMAVGAVWDVMTVEGPLVGEGGMRLLGTPVLPSPILEVKILLFLHPGWLCPGMLLPAASPAAPQSSPGGWPWGEGPGVSLRPSQTCRRTPSQSWSRCPGAGSSSWVPWERACPTQPHCP